MSCSRMLAAALLLFVPVAHAGKVRKLPAYYCEPATKISEKVESCEDNDAYIEQAEQCLDNFDADVAKASTTLSATLSPGAEGAQAAKFGVATQDYQTSSASLAYLIAVNELAISEMDSYLQNLEMPEDADEPEVTGGDPEKYAMSVTCFGESTRSLQSVKADFLQKLKELKSAKAVADAAAANANGSHQKIGVGQDSSPQIAHGRGAGSGIPSAKAVQTGSDITGVRDDKAKQQK